MVVEHPLSRRALDLFDQLFPINSAPLTPRAVADATSGTTKAQLSTKIGAGAEQRGNISLKRRTRCATVSHASTSGPAMKLPEALAIPKPDPDSPKTFRFIDLFAGIGGMRIPFEEAGGECVFSSEWDKFAQDTYEANFGERPSGDITEIPARDIPEHDVLLAGFPCQAFSLAGFKQGFYDTRGTMFFEVQRILAARRPKMFLLENVKQLRGHDGGRTLNTILKILRGAEDVHVPDEVPMSLEARRSLAKRLDYCADFRVIGATEFGVPQNRERIYIVGFDRAVFGEVDLQQFFGNLEGRGAETSLADALEPTSSNYVERFTLTDRLWDGLKARMARHVEKGNGFGHKVFDRDAPYCNTITSRYYKDGREILIDQASLGRNPRRLTPRECARIQGFPEWFDLSACSDTQLYRQFGNSVSVPVIRAIARSVVARLAAVEEKEATAVG
jgi:DNA (cytosine-5)-methyltransferase 1